MSAGAATVSPALRALLHGVVDYAGLFPPAGLSMRGAVAEYAAQQSSPQAWMLGRFVVPVGRLDELVSEAASYAGAGQGVWPLSALVSADPAGEAEVIRGFNSKHRGRFVVESVELRAPTVDAIDWALPALDPTLERYVEIPLGESRALLQAIRQHGARAKARTGGITPDAFPTATELAHFIVSCAQLEVPFKATAGLHHPLRGEQRLTYDSEAPTATMFGFLDVFVAATFARSGADEDVLVRLLEERDAAAFTFDGDVLRWRDRVLDVAQVKKARRDFALSFGSCSFREPVDDLHRLGVL